jgi:hypothetical protein
MHELGGQMPAEAVQQLMVACKGRDREKCGLVTGEQLGFPG